MKKLFLWILVAFSLFLGNSDPKENSLLDRELARLTERGLTYRIVNNDNCSTCGGEWIEVCDPLINQTWRFPTDPLAHPRQPKYTGLPTLTINLTTIDTNLYNQKYHYVNSMPLSGEWGFALQVGDLNQNKKPEAYGEYYTQTEFASRIYELSDSNKWELRNSLNRFIGAIDHIEDIDENGLKEIYGHQGDSLFAYEQNFPTGFPLHRKFGFRQWYFSAAGIPNMIDDVNGDGMKELVYRGSEPDSQTTNVQKLYVAKYDSMLNNFRPVWGRQLPPGCLDFCTGNIATGDFDSDGSKDFVSSAFEGNVYVIEHVVSDSFAVVWSDSLSIAGRVASGDVDGNGIEEFFVGGNQGEPDGYVHMRMYAYERTGNNTYQPVFAFNIFPSGYFFVDLYQTADIDGDGQKELLLSFGGGVLIIKGTGSHQYSVFFYKSTNHLDCVSVGYSGHATVPNLFVSTRNIGRDTIDMTDVYRLDSTLTHVEDDKQDFPVLFSLKQNYPNPFNPSTMIEYSLSVHERMTLKIYNQLGQEIATLVDGVENPGRHSIAWNAVGVSSGVYFSRLETPGVSLTRKFLLIR